MPAATVKSSYLAGFRDGAPFVLVVIPFAMLFGVAATEAGLSIGQTMGFTALVIAGASQFAALQMMLDNASVTLIVLAALAVNLRMAMYSAALVPWLGKAPMWQRALVSYINFDQTFLASVARYEARPEMTVPMRIGYFLGVTTPVAPTWVAMTAVGIFVGGAIPPEYGLDFALPITFLALVAPMLRTLAHVAAALTSIIVTLSLIWLPSGAGLLIAGFCAMGLGVLVEEWTQK